MISLIVGLGNPGREHEGDRHNAGADFVELLARDYNTELKADKKFFGLYAKARISNKDVHLLIPTTYMNLSGKSISAVANFYKVKPEEILVCHDELDFQPGDIKLKQGGGHGGHNGLRDTVSALGNNKNFLRLRIGIGHPGDAKLVSNYVLKNPNKQEQEAIEESFDRARHVINKVIEGDLEKAMHQLHS